MKDSNGMFKLPGRISIPGLRQPYCIDRINGKVASRIGTKTPESWVNRKVANMQAYQARIVKCTIPTFVYICQAMESIIVNLSTLMPVSPVQMTGNPEMDARLAVKEETSKLAFQSRRGEYTQELEKTRVQLEGLHSQVAAFMAETQHITKAHIEAYCQGRRANVEYEIAPSESVNNFRTMLEDKEQLAAQIIKNFEE